MQNKETLEATSLSCRKILRTLSGYLLLHKDLQKSEDRKIAAILNLMYRMNCNILTVKMIADWSQKRDNTVFLKLPMGVLLRTVLTDSIHAMFFSSISDVEVVKELELLRMGYAYSLLDRTEVYIPTSTMEGKFSVLHGDPTFGELSKRVYQYYRYFSQYEHFSEEGQGDILVPFGDDNIHFPSATKVIEETVETLIKELDL